MATGFGHSISLDAPLVRSDNRLEAYSDALFAIVATVMVLPVLHTEIPEDEALSTSFVRLLLPKISVYIYTFLVVCVLWTRHVKLFDVIDNVDEFAVLMNLAMLMVITFFPFSFTLLSEYPLSPITMQIFSGTLMFLCCLRFLMIWYVFRNPRMIRQEVKENNQQDIEKMRLYASTITVFVLALVTFIMSFISEIVALVCLAFILIGDIVRSYFVKLYQRCFRSGNELDQLTVVVPLRKSLVTDVISKERIEYFSDGVFAIVATLIILDICEDDIPNSETVKEMGSLEAALSENSYIFLAYAGTFLTVGLQWYVHHSLLHYVKEVTKLMMICNFMCLMAVGISPMAFKLTSTFDNHHGDNNEAMAIQVTSTVMLLTGLSQSAFWISALFYPEKCLQAASHHKGRDHMYMACKLAVLPLMSLVMFFLSLIPGFKATMFIGIQISAVAVYILLGLLFTEMRKWSDRSSVRVPEINETPTVEDNQMIF